jgi:hypothetical protein
MTRRTPPIKSARAIMASRKEPNGSLDFFPTPPWATRALMEAVFPAAELTRLWRRGSAWDPACGEGHMSEVLVEYFGHVYSTDIHDYGYQGTYSIGTANFLTMVPGAQADWIITNPPFKTSLDFVLRALDLSRVGVAMFIRTQWAIEGCGRYEKLFRDRPPTLFAPFVERVPLCKGHWDPDGSTATAYCWLVWVHGREPMAPFWIPPGQRKLLTRPDDRERFAAWSIPTQEAAE